MSKATFISLFFLLLLVVSMFPVVHSYAEVGKWFYWMEPGVYVTLTLSNEVLPILPGWGSLHDPETSFQFLNKTLLGFNNASITWKVLEVSGSEALVEYTIVLIDAYIAERDYRGRLQFVSPVGDVHLLSTSVWVKMDTLEVYSENETYVGRWPFWVHNYEVNSTIMMVHDVLKTALINGSFVRTHMDQKVGLLELDSGGNPQVGIDTSLGFFVADRLLGCNPTMERVDSRWLSAGVFPALYDEVSLIMITYGGTYIDDVIRYVLGDIYNGIYLDKPLIISATNIDLNPREKPGSFKFPLVLGIVIAATIATAGGLLYVWKKKSR
ncbi:hypothetical protein A3K79_01360 [Candidatus Bathyarchaeota archaeon RBG_13_46_16b]|nr:MAG: hypothetical protein A3K79_01360 [Candidatus Bathyarchaeota archaeon RBG_13_46_16b]